MGLLRGALLALVLACCGYENLDVTRPAYERPAARDKLLWPFAQDSIWNTAIGSGAVFEPVAPAGIPPVAYVGAMWSYVVEVAADDPLRPLFAPGPRPNQACTGTHRWGDILVPDDLVLSASQNANPGNATSFLQPDGRTLVEVSGLARCARGGPVFGFPYPGDDIYGAGLRGGMGGSGLSSIGGSLRRGEITGEGPIWHALKIAIAGERWLWFDPAEESSCFTWPADRCDGGRANPLPGGYHGTNPKLRMGSLLAIPPRVRIPTLGLKTSAGHRLFEALQSYGAYVAGTPGRDGVLFGMEAGAVSDFVEVFGHSPQVSADDATGKAWLDDVNAILGVLEIVVNNGPASIGGGGTPGMPLAPPIAN